MNRVEILEKLNDIYLQRRQKSADDNRARMDEVCQKHKDIETLLNERHTALLQRVKHNIGKMNGEVDLRQFMEEKNAQIRTLLVKYGYPEDYLQPKYHCEKCKDEGKIFFPTTKECDCLIEAYHKLAYDNMGFSKVEEQTFGHYDDTVYSENILPQFGVSQRKYMNGVYQQLLCYATEFPNQVKTTKNLLLRGQSGLGKTFFMHAIANEVIKKRKFVRFVTAFKWFETAKNAYFGNQIDEYENLLNADVLMIDDLGTEPLNENITIPQLFNVINERHNKGLHTIFSTNLEPDKLRERYTERIMSRLEDRRFTTIIPFYGDDVRRNMKKS